MVSFYSYLRVPHDCVRVCTGPVCDCFGARDLLARAQERMEDGVPVIEVPCLGHCDLAPVGTRGDTMRPGLMDAPVTHEANDGPSTGLAQADETLLSCGLSNAYEGVIGQRFTSPTNRYA